MRPRAAFALLGCLVGVVLTVVTSPAASAYWSSSGASASNSARTGTLTAPVVTATGGVASATVSWTATSGAGGTPSYYVVRTNTATSATSAACSTSASAPITTRSCSDTGVAAGTYTYTVFATLSDWTTQGASASVTVTAPAAAKLAFTTQPGNATAGVAFSPQPVVAVEDASGAVITSNTSTITLTITTPNGATLTCSPSSNAQAAVAGVASFAGCQIQRAGTYTLTATGTGLTTTSSSFTVTAAAASQLVFTTQPGDTYAGKTFPTSPAVTIEDAFGNVVTSPAQTITLKLNPSSGGLTCAARASSSGVATFTGCSVATVGTGYTLTASSGTLAGATSSTFTVWNAPSALLLTGISTTCGSGSTPANSATLLLTGCSGRTVTASVTLTDGSGNAVPNLTGAAITLTLTATPATSGVTPGTLTIPVGSSVSPTTFTFAPGSSFLLSTLQVAASGYSSAQILVTP